MPAPQSFLEKSWNRREIRQLEDGRSLMFIDRLLLHELTAPRAFEDIEARGLKVARPDLAVGFADHIVTTASGRRGEAVDGATEMLEAMRGKTERHGILHFDVSDERQGIVHVVAPELGLILPGMTVVCGDSHTCTSGGLGALGWGIGTSEVAQVLATQTLTLRRPKTMRVNLTGRLPAGASAKDVVLALIARFGVAAGVGHMIEFAGTAVVSMTVEQRMTLCNMAIEFGARIGTVAPDETTLAYLAERPFAPPEARLDAVREEWLSLRSDPGATHDAEIALDVGDLRPQITWGTTPGDTIAIDEPVPTGARARALEYMGLEPGTRLTGLPISRVFIGSCTNGRLSDLREAASVLDGRRVADGVRAMIVPGSQSVKRAAEAEGLAERFRSAGFEWREPGCSMCPGLNLDRGDAGDRVVSTTNRNFENRQGGGVRTHLASPATAAASALAGAIADPRLPIGAQP